MWEVDTGWSVHHCAVVSGCVRACVNW